MGSKKPNNQKSTTFSQKEKIDSFYGTKAEWVKAELEGVSYSSVFGTDLKDKVVVAEDEKGLYLTGKSYVGALVLDPHRINKRIVPIEKKTEDGKTFYEVPQMF